MSRMPCSTLPRCSLIIIYIPISTVVFPHHRGPLRIRFRTQDCQVRAFYGRTPVGGKNRFTLRFARPAGRIGLHGNCFAAPASPFGTAGPAAARRTPQGRRAARLLSSRPHRRRPGRRTTGDATCRRASSSCPRRPRLSSSCASARTASSGGSRRPSSYPSPARCVRGAGR